MLILFHPCKNNRYCFANIQYPEAESKELALGPHLLCQQTTEILSTVFHAKDLPERRGEIQVTSLPSVLLSVARLSLAVTCRSKAYSLLQNPLRYTSYTGATVEVR